MNNNPPNTFPNGRYGPYGHNNNNQGRQNVPSNMYPQNGGMQGSQFGRFNPISTNTQQMMNNTPSMTNFNKSFQPNAPMIERYDYKNQNEVIHNNIGDTVLDEHIVEYRINIDSLDRDISVYKNPFCFTVKFNPTSDSTDKYDKSKKMHGTPKPHILKEFKNVKYVKLDSVILPQFSKTTKEDGEYVFDHDSLLIDDRFIALRIKEFDDSDGIRTFDTGDGSLRTDEDGNTHSYPKPFGLIFPDKLLGRCYYTGTPYHTSIINRNSTLQNITQMTIEFYDSCGKKIEYNDLLDVGQLENCQDYDDGQVPLSDLRHPLNKKIQVHLSFIIGVVEPQQNTNTKFEQ
jgi:hypothetical protein